jgi:non-heme chloroperoxidase
MKSYSNYLRTFDNEQIYYATNFEHNGEAQENVLVFNYGLVCSNFHWSKQLDYYDQKGYKILIHDYRGHYQSSGIDRIENITFENISRDIHALYEELNIKSSIIFGHSMGVNVCLEFAKKYPHLVKKMILISGTIIPVYNIMFNTNLTDQITPKLIQLLKAYPKPFEYFWKSGGWNPLIKKLVHAGGFNLKTVSKEFIEIYLNKLGQLGPQLFFQLVEQMNKHDILTFIGKIKTPTLIIGGDNDKVIPNYLQKLTLKEMPNAELYVVRNGSHVPQVDFPNMVNERVDFFLEH